MAMIALVVDDHPMCRAATAMALGVVRPELAVVEAASIAEARTHAGDAALMTLDLGLPDSRGLAGLNALHDDFPALPILVISGAENPAVRRQIARIGARGFLPKAAPIGAMIEALREVLAERQWFPSDPDDAGSDGRADDDYARLATLTPAQHRVLVAMEDGRLNKQIAFDLGLSEITIKAHVKAILKKLGVVNRTQAILLLRATL